MNHTHSEISLWPINFVDTLLDEENQKKKC